MASVTDEDLIIKKEDFRKVVFKVVDGIVERIPVETGISDNTHIQITNGIEAGDEIVIGSYRTLSRTLKNEDKVTVSNGVDSKAKI